MILRHLALTAALILLPALAWAQGALLQAGPATPGHGTMLLQNGFLQDQGPAGSFSLGQGLSETLQVNRAAGTGPLGTHNCSYDQPSLTGAAGAHYLCWDPNAQGGALIALGPLGAAAPTVLNFAINGSMYQFPGNGQGNILGPNSSCIGCLAYFNNTTGTLASSLPQLVLTQTGFPQPTHGFTIDVTATLNGSYGAGPTAANFLHTINTGTQSGNSNFTSTLLIEHEFGGSTVIGGQNALEVDGYFDKGATSASNTNRNYTGGFFQMVAFSGDGGTNVNNINTTAGSIFGIGTFGDAKVGTALTNVSGGEINVALETGTSASEKTGLQIVDHALDKVSGTAIDAALAIGAQPGGIGFQNAILLSNGNGASPLTSTGCVLCTTANMATVATGVDLSQYNITGYAWKSTGAFISGAGALSGIALTMTGANPATTQPAQTHGSFISSNYTNGNNEADWFNQVIGGGGFYFYQLTSGAPTLVMNVTGTGSMMLAGGMTAPGGYSMTPTTETDTGPCGAGQIAWDANFIYVCTSTNVFKRVALASY
jgi:hypothetical protein